MQNAISSRYIYDRDDFWSPISFHIVRDSNSLGGVPLYRLVQAITDLNNMYNSSELHFYQLSVDYIDDDIYYSIDDYEELNELRFLNGVENSINIYIVSLLNAFFGVMTRF